MYVERAAGSSNEALRRGSFADALAWTEEEGASRILGGATNRVVRVRGIALPVIEALLLERDASRVQPNHDPHRGYHVAFLQTNNSKTQMITNNDTQDSSVYDPVDTHVRQTRSSYETKYTRMARVSSNDARVPRLGVRLVHQEPVPHAQILDLLLQRTGVFLFLPPQLYQGRQQLVHVLPPNAARLERIAQVGG